MAGSDYVELRCRSAFSFLEGSSNPEELVDCAAGLDYPALALADRHGVYGSPRFHQAAAAAGLHAIVGAQVDIAAEPEAPGAGPAGSLLLLVESPAGYRNLCRLLTRGHARCAKGAAAVSWQEVEHHAGGLTALVRGDGQLQPALLDRALASFGRERLWVDVSRHLERAACAVTRRAVTVAEAGGVPIVATNDVRHARPEGRQLLDALTCLRWKTSLDRAGRRLAQNAERHLRSRRDMAQRFADRPEWLRASRSIAERCAFSLANLGYRFPRFPVPPGATQASQLRRLTRAGRAGAMAGRCRRGCAPSSSASSASSRSSTCAATS